MPLFVVKVGYSEYKFSDGAQTDDNHWTLEEHDDQGAADHSVWIAQCEEAERWGSQELEYDCEDCGHTQGEGTDCEECDGTVHCVYEEDYGEFVERVAAGIALPYDPTNKDHWTLPGFEDQRPERVAYIKAYKEEEKQRKLIELQSRKQELLYELSAIESSIKELTE